MNNIYCPSWTWKTSVVRIVWFVPTKPTTSLHSTRPFG